jgi:rod shape determining protein RodA
MLILATTLILALSFTTLFSIQSSLLLSQAIALIIGLVIAFLIYKSDLIVLKSVSLGFYLFSIILLVAVLFLGNDIRGSSRWFHLGLFNLQPSEVVKPMLAIFFASFLSDNPPKNIKNIITYLSILLLPTLLILFEPDLGSSLVILFLGLSLLFFSGLPYKFLTIGLIILSFIIIPAHSFLAPYQKERITSFINPYSDPYGTGYNVIQSIIAIGSGSFFGQGIKQGSQSQLQFLPEHHTDFIFASFTEEFGLLGATILIGLFLLILFKSYLVSLKIKDPFRKLLLLGIISIFAFESTVNIAVNLGLLPVTGITLPLFSYGGSSLITHLSLLGLFLLLDRSKTSL